jgi:hypothetical protein
MQDVEENPAATLQQAKRNCLNPKRNAKRSQSCGALRFATPTQRENQTALPTTTAVQPATTKNNPFHNPTTKRFVLPSFYEDEE